MEKSSFILTEKFLSFEIKAFWVLFHWCKYFYAQSSIAAFQTLSFTLKKEVCKTLDFKKSMFGLSFKIASL